MHILVSIANGKQCVVAVHSKASLWRAIETRQVVAGIEIDISRLINVDERWCCGKILVFDSPLRNPHSAFVVAHNLAIAIEHEGVDLENTRWRRAPRSGNRAVGLPNVVDGNIVGFKVFVECKHASAGTTAHHVDRGRRTSHLCAIVSDGAIALASALEKLCECPIEVARRRAEHPRVTIAPIGNIDGALVIGSEAVGISKGLTTTQDGAVDARIVGIICPQAVGSRAGASAVNNIETSHVVAFRAIVDRHTSTGVVVDCIVAIKLCYSCHWLPGELYRPIHCGVFFAR